jgi:ATP-dependent helicase/nuclease subunit A
MRVLYVAMTRARDRLIMTYAAKKLDADMQDIALRFDFDGGDLLCRSAVCPGDWVLMEAISRMEAGGLHALGGRPKNLHMSDYPWKICIGQATKAEATLHVQESEGPTIPQGAVEKIGNALRFRYDHMAATIAPSKQTATGRKGRVKDAEAAEDTQEAPVKIRTFRRPSFLEQMQRGKEYGNAIHNAMQFIRYENCGSVDAVREEVSRLVEKGFLTEEQGSIVNCEKIARFFESPFGRQLRDGTPYIREFKFSILDEGENFDPSLKGEKILLQGVVDCALLEADGITVVDFKTDKVTESTLQERATQYRPQVLAYADALHRIYQKPIKQTLLYFFHLGKLVLIEQ